MRRSALYSRSPGAPLNADDLPHASPEAPPGATLKADASATGRGTPNATQAPAATPSFTDAPPAPAASRPIHRARWHMPALLALTAALAGAGAWFWPHGSTRSLTQKDIDAAVLHTLSTASLPSPTARAAAAIAPSVVQVVAYGSEKTTPAARTERRGRNLARGRPPEATPPPGEVERGIGTGVVIVDKGVILTNFHVIAGAEKIKVTFFDGLEAPASVIDVRPESDLAVLQAQKIPDDLAPATLRTSADLSPGDHVAAVGFPFGIGPSVSAGVVSGLHRAFRSPEGQQQLNDLIQFDAAANPGNSGGPLINMDGEVVGIVTAILNPTHQRTFIGIGFAMPIESAASAAGLPPF